MKKILTILLLGGSFFAFQYFSGIYNADFAEASNENFWEELKQEEQRLRSERKAPKYNFSYYTIVEGDTFATALQSEGIAYSSILSVLEAATDIYDFTKVKLGSTLRLVTDNSILNRLEYDLNSDEMVVVTINGDDYIAELVDIEYEKKEIARKNSIDSSLFLAAEDVGVDDKAILEMAEVFAWNIDFAVQVQKGDDFSILYQDRYRDGKKSSAGDVLAATFTTGGSTFRAYRYEMPDGSIKYFDENGDSLIRAFLKAPLKYNRITSGFTYGRFHPILQKNMPHMAIDYAAPSGTPIYAVGDGKISFAGWKNGFGNFIDIRHNGTYQTQYAHLSRFAKGISPGVTVTQGDLIGYVGSTGFSTGPHLHYQIEKNGSLVDPTKVELPKGESIPEELQDQFFKEKASLDAKLSKAQ